MLEFLTSGSTYFPGWVSILFSIGLGMGIVHHAPCVVLGHGNRWFHAGHTVMSLSMIYMYLSMSYDWTWLPGAWQMWFFAVTSAVVAAYLGAEITRGRAVNLSWVLLLAQHVAMIYMWYPMMRWNSVLVFVLVCWFAVETFGWAANLLPDDVRARGHQEWLPYRVGRTPAPEVGRAEPEGVASATVSGAVTTEARCDRHTDVLIASTWQNRAAMTVMALSMSYMFYGMELIRVSVSGMMM